MSEASTSDNSARVAAENLLHQSKLTRTVSLLYLLSSYHTIYISMELGFQPPFAGPLTQLSVQLFSMETAIHFAVGAHGWWTARLNAQSLQMVLSSRNANLVSVNAFNLRAYIARRTDFPSYGAARQPGGRFLSIILPKASTNVESDPGTCCLRAFTTALLCFLDEDTTTRILIEMVPEYLVHYDQDDVKLEKDGALSPAIQARVHAIELEEETSRLRESLLKNFDEQHAGVSGASRHDIRAGETIDINEIQSMLAWIALSPGKRESEVYPTRSFLVWAIAFVLADLKFRIDVCKTAITTVEQYQKHVEKDLPPSIPTVYFVGASVGVTDPRPIPKHEIRVPPKYRYIPINTIPIVELRQYRLEEFQKEKLILAWKETFEHVQQYLTKLPHIREMMGLHSANIGRALRDIDTEKYKPLTQYQSKGLFERSRFWTRSQPESFEALLSPLVSRYLPKECPDCVSLFTSDHAPGSCWSKEASGDHNEIARLYLNAILLASSYAIACLFVRDGDSLASIGTEVVFTPSEAKTLGNCFELKDWCETMMSIAAVGSAQKRSTKVDSGHVRFKASLFEAVSGFENGQFASPATFGCFSKGVSMVSLFLLKPMHPASYLAYEVKFGQTLDLPLDENSLVESIEKQGSSKPYEFSPASNIVQSFSPQEELQRNQMPRWDIEPDWISAPQNIHFRCRVAGVPQCSLSPRWLQPQLAGIHRIPCRCLPFCSQRAKSAPDSASSTDTQPGLDEIWSEVPYAKVRSEGSYPFRLTAIEKLPPHKRRYILVRVTDDEFEQALALTFLCDPSLSGQEAVVERFLAECLARGVRAARERDVSSQTINVLFFVT